MIDWGWFYFITRPLFKLMEFINSIVHNFGVTILILTVLVKAAFFPLANKQYTSMARMKKLQPEMQRIKELYKDDAQRQQKEIFDLYKRRRSIRWPDAGRSCCRSRSSSRSIRCCSSRSTCATRRSSAGFRISRHPIRLRF